MANSWMHQGRREKAFVLSSIFFKFFFGLSVEGKWVACKAGSR